MDFDNPLFFFPMQQDNAIKKGKTMLKDTYGTANVLETQKDSCRKGFFLWA